jgi:8-oxo-dGTP diphosphatase
MGNCYLKCAGRQFTIGIVNTEPKNTDPNASIAIASIRYTLCFLTRGENVLMLHRLKPPNRGLWNGVGGRLENGETPHQGILREVLEETGFQIQAARFAGVLTWDGFETPPGGLYIFTAEAPLGEPGPCSEGELAWKPRQWVFSSPKVVSNIHVFGPLVLEGAPPRLYHFSYRDGEIVYHTTAPLFDGMNVG